jgi:DNA-binding CsgD family transcriptional regulator
MSLSGNLKTMDLAELLQWVTLGRKTGSLAFIQNKIKNYIYFRDGGIISSRSNEPTKQLGHFLLFQGKISEEQLKRGLELQQRHHQHLGKILVQEGFISQDEVEKALVDRTQEVIYDIFLWDDGYFHFASSGYNLEDLILINLDINTILFEGVRRKDEWNRIRQTFPTNEVLLSLRPGADPKTLPLTPIQKKLLFLVTRGKTISEMILELHGSEFLVNDELYKLYDKGVLEVQAVLQAPAAQVEQPSLINRGVELMQARKPREALAVFQEVLRIDPQNATVDQYIAQAEKTICEEFYAGSISPQKVPYFLVPETSMTQYNLTHEEGFVASRINGNWDLKSIVMLSPLREIEILQIVDKLMKMGLIGLK